MQEVRPQVLSFCSIERCGASEVIPGAPFFVPRLVRFCRQAWRCRQNRAFGGVGYTFVPANVFAGATFSSVQGDRAHFLVRKRACRAHKSANFGPGGGVRGPKSVHGPLPVSPGPQIGPQTCLPCAQIGQLWPRWGSPRTEKCTRATPSRGKVAPAPPSAARKVYPATTAHLKSLVSSDTLSRDPRRSSRFCQLAAKQKECALP